MKSLNFEQPLEFQEGDIGMAGAGDLGVGFRV